MPGVFKISGAEVLDDGVEYINSSGEADDTIVASGGDVEVETGGLAVGTTVSSGATLSNFWLANDTVVEGLMTDAGTAFQTKVARGGIFLVLPAGIANVTTVDSGGSMTVFGHASGTTLLGATVTVNGGSVSNTIVNGGMLGLLLGGSSTSALVESGGKLDDLAGCIVSGTKLIGTDSGLSELLVSGIAKDTVIHSYGLEEVFTPGTASQTSMFMGGKLQDYGTISDTTMSGGLLVVQGAGILNPGIANGTMVTGGDMQVKSDGKASNTTVSNEGQLDVSGGGSASGVAIKSGGKVYVESGGLVSAATISGGKLVLESGAKVATGGISFAGGGTLLIAGTGTYGPVAGFAVPDMLDLAAVNFLPSTIKQFNSKTDTLTVTDGVHSVSIELLGHYTAGSFHLGAAAGGGTLVTDPAAGATISSMIGSPHH
jgi:autotransporter passenger strand-loop-strand repeat protein